MIITLFGATGRTGMALIKDALARGHEIRAAVRTAKKLGEFRDRVTALPADVLDAEAVAHAIDGADAVVSVIGHSKNSRADLQKSAAEHIVAAMKRHDLRRIVALTGAGVRFPEDRPKLFDRVIRLLLKKMQPVVLADSEEYTRIITSSDLDWTVVRGPMLHDKPVTGAYRAGYVGSGPGPRASRAHIAELILDELENGNYLGQAPVVSD